MSLSIKGIRTREGVAEFDLSNNYQDLENKPIIVNPNLLDNWYFGNPVNQRGSKETTTASGSVYFVDRWIVYRIGTIASLETDGIKLTAPDNNYTSLMQRMEKGTAELNGKTFTASVLYDEGLLQVTGTVVDTATNTTFARISNSSNTRILNFAYTPAQGVFLEFRIVAGENATIKGMKLELGDTQTLAHQDENGDWVLNEIPNYANQLARCQRYYQIFSSSDARPTALADYRPNMRTAPSTGTIEVDDVTYYYARADL